MMVCFSAAGSSTATWPVLVMKAVKDGNLKKRGLVALKEYFEKVYQPEGGRAHFDLSENELKITVDACPAVTHLRKSDYPVAELFFETTKTVNETICEGTSFAAELLDYNLETGSGIQRFYCKESN